MQCLSVWMSSKISTPAPQQSSRALRTAACLAGIPQSVVLCARQVLSLIEANSHLGAEPLELPPGGPVPVGLACLPPPPPWGSPALVSTALVSPLTN